MEGEDILPVENGYKVQLVGNLQKYYNRVTNSYIIEINMAINRSISVIHLSL